MIICRHFANSLPATESLSQVYKLKNQTYIEQCQRQLKILKLYYGDHLQLPINNVSVLQLPLPIHTRTCNFSSVKSCAHIGPLLRQNQNTVTRLDENQFLSISLRKHGIWLRDLTITSFILPFLFKYNRKNDWFIIAHHMLPFDSLIWYALTTTKLWHGWMQRKDSYFLWGMVYSEQCQ